MEKEREKKRTCKRSVCRTITGEWERRRKRRKRGSKGGREEEYNKFARNQSGEVFAILFLNFEKDSLGFFLSLPEILKDSRQFFRYFTGMWWIIFSETRVYSQDSRRLIKNFWMLSFQMEQDSSRVLLKERESFMLNEITISSPKKGNSEDYWDTLRDSTSFMVVLWLDSLRDS